MCGRFNITTDPKALFDMFDLLLSLDERKAFEPRYNIAPSEPPIPPGSKRQTARRISRVPVIRRHREALVVNDAIWPLIPVWARGEVQKYSTANARSETMHERASYRGAWKQGQRCLIPATGFYEWQDVGDRTKQPWNIHPLNEPFFLFGGLWESSTNIAGNAVLSCTIVTLDANSLMREIHNAGANKHRMPLMLDRRAADVWLNGSVDEARAVVTPMPADEMAAYEIGRAINNPNHDNADILQPHDRTSD